MGSHSQESNFENSVLESTCIGSSAFTQHFENINANLSPINSNNDEGYDFNLNFFNEELF